MEKRTIRKEIAALINSIKEHSDNIGNNEQIPQLELELILHKIEKLYQKSIVFNYINSVPNAEELTTKVNSVRESADPNAEPSKQTVNNEITSSVESSILPIDLFGSELPPVVEKAKPEKKTHIHQLQNPAISNLNSAIGINEKFQFANELFEGNVQEYNIAINQLNSAGTIESAMEYFSSLQQLYSWETDNETVKKLLDLVDRRYG